MASALFALPSLQASSLHKSPSKILLEHENQYLIFTLSLSLTRLPRMTYFFSRCIIFVHDVSTREKAQARQQKQANYPINNVTNRSCGAFKGINPAQVVILLPNVFIGAAFARRQSAKKEIFCIASHQDKVVVCFWICKSQWQNSAVSGSVLR